MPRRSALLLTALAACNPGDPGDSTSSEASTSAGESSSAGLEGGLYTLHLDHYEPEDPPVPLRINNETLLVPLARGAKVQDLTRAMPGDLVVAYTRITCGVGDPNPFLVDLDPAVPPGPVVRLRSIEVDEVFTEDGFDGTCFATRKGGVWSVQTDPTAIEHREGFKTTTLAFAGDTDAVAIFFPNYTDVTEIRYEVVE